MRAQVIYFAVTNDLNYDQRMIRIADTLSKAGFMVHLVGRKMKNSIPLQDRSWQQKRISLLFNKGWMFYAEYTIRLFFYLLFRKMDIVCAIDLDTVLPCLFISRIKKIRRVFDAHEWFCGMKEVISRPRILKTWKKIERYALPCFHYGYTVSAAIAEAYHQSFGLNYQVIRNLPINEDLAIPVKGDRYLIYQGAVNEGRCFETLLPAMQQVPIPLYVFGEGNFMQQAMKLSNQLGLEGKVFFKGCLPPVELRSFTQHAWAGINLLEDTVPNNRYSLANRFFDYMQAAIPQLCSRLPGYEAINHDHEVALLVDASNVESVAAGLKKLLEDEMLYEKLQQQCLAAREIFNWQQEEKKLLAFYEQFRH